ncbi:MAG: VIT domain-containing protein [Bacteroidota bacterium]
MKKFIRTLLMPALTIALLTMTVLTVPVFAQSDYNHLMVLNPQRNWDQRPGTIEEATFSVRPKGIYAEVGVYLTFSSRGAAFSGAENLEVEFRFELPDDAIMTDSWLWVGDQIMRAQLIDRWTATEIYEGIVNRNRDPSLLTKKNQTQYELRVFPMRNDMPRKVKLTYLVPVDWTLTDMHIPLPFDWLEDSRHEIETVNILAWPGEHWTAPRLLERPDVTVETLSDEGFGMYHRMQLEPSERKGLTTLSFEAPLESGVFMSNLDTEEDGFYQLAYLPAVFSLDGNPQRNVAVLIDFSTASTTVALEEMLLILRQALKDNLAPTDQFTVIYSQADIRRASETWLPATPDAIDGVFDTLDQTVLANYSNLPAMLANGIAFVNDLGVEGSLFVISSTDALGDKQVSDRLMADLVALSAPEPLPVMLFADLANDRLTTTRDNGIFHAGNSLLYAALARESGGQFVTIRDGKPLSTLSRELLAGADGGVEAFDLYASLQSGFTYGRFTHTTSQIADVIPLHSAVTQVGRYLGDTPFVIQASGVFDAEPFSNQIDIVGEEVSTSDSTLVAYWTGNQIDALEQRQQDDNTIVDIIEFSLGARVISLYTAFLALEPGVNEQEPCGDECEDETALVTSVDDEVPGEMSVNIDAYPNPFVSHVTITVTFPEVVDFEAVTFEIFNTMGQRVALLRPASVNGRVAELVWDGTTDAGAPAANGIYFFVMTSPAGRHTHKLVLVR